LTTASLAALFRWAADFLIFRHSIPSVWIMRAFSQRLIQTEGIEWRENATNSSESAEKEQPVMPSVTHIIL